MSFLGRSKDPQKELEKALRAGDHQKAIPFYETLLERDRKNQQLRLRYADSLAVVKRKKDAVKQYVIVAQDMATTGFLIKAIAVYKKMVVLDPSREDFHRELAEMNRAREAGENYLPPEERAKAKAAAKEAAKEAKAAEPEPEAPASVPVSEAEPVAEEPVEEEPAPEPAAVEAEGAPDEGPTPLEAMPMPPPPDEEDEPALAPPEPVVEEPAPPAAEEVPAPPAAEESDELDSFLDQAVRPATPDELARAAASAEAARESAEKDGTGVPQIPRIPLFSDLSIDEFAAVVAALRHYFYPPGEVIVEEGAPGDSMFIVVQGSVRVTTRTPAGKVVELATLGEGEFFGEVALLSGKPRTASITSAEETEVMELGRSDFREIAGRHPHVKQTLEKFWKERSERTVETMVSAMRGDE